ncbi:Signal transduction histidine kinase [Haloplanus vescus]|uniref:Signal transduction histidine kinase n=1 Tax=Haloplanus vescus TaxID=555874 RepID=A0A1H3WCB7_9EURY|nr:ATP-binding protein [Haloplanus vescus]SDZ84777.1 Signal transduction histidine kinase [Haloplanus vescus]
MDVPAWERRLAGHAPSLIAVLGGLVAVVAVAQFLRDIETLGVGVFPVVALGLCLSLSAGLFGLGRWLANSDLPVADTWTVARWCLGGMAGFGALAALTIGIRLAEGQVVDGAALTLVVMASGGGIGGGVAGIYYARATLAAREADHRRDALVFLNSHLRHNVLNAAQVIQGYTDLLADRTDESRYLDPIERRSAAIASLIDDMKELADLFSGEHTPTALDISTVILREVEHARETHESATFDVDIPPELYVQATGAVSAVFANLIQNAVEHNDAESPSVTIRADRHPRTVSVHIVDDGPGMRDEVKATLFDSAIESGEGRGIALVKTVMNHYGGDVRARDNDPRGTEVVVEFRRPPSR